MKFGSLFLSCFVRPQCSKNKESTTGLLWISDQARKTKLSSKQIYLQQKQALYQEQDELFPYRSCLGVNFLFPQVNYKKNNNYKENKSLLCPRHIYD